MKKRKTEINRYICILLRKIRNEELGIRNYFHTDDFYLNDNENNK